MDRPNMVILVDAETLVTAPEPVDPDAIRMPGMAMCMAAERPIPVMDDVLEPFPDIDMNNPPPVSRPRRIAWSPPHTIRENHAAAAVPKKPTTSLVRVDQVPGVRSRRSLSS